MKSDTNFSSRLDRLIALQGTDPGFFTLAVHSFIEAALRERYDLVDSEASFSDVLHMFIEDCSFNSPDNHLQNNLISAVKRIKASHKETNDVRHMFSFLEEEKARIATAHLKIFCSLFGLEEQGKLNELEKYLTLWNEKMSLGELRNEFQRLYNGSTLIAGEYEILLDQVEQLRNLKENAEFFSVAIKKQSLEIERLEKDAKAKISKIDELRANNYKDRENLKKAKKHIDELKVVESYVDTLRNMTIYTRTRGDYERLIIRLTPEQQDVVKHITLHKDFLIKGSAGTGKTLVLLKAIEKVYKGDGIDSMILLTYTNALVKYDAYIASILHREYKQTFIETADAFFLERLQELDPVLTPSTSVLEPIISKYSMKNLSTKEIVTEIESVIWKDNLDYSTYVENMIVRKGMRNPLRQQERKEMWAVKESVERDLEKTEKPFKYLPVLILRAIERGEIEKFTRFDYIFVDEAQDLTSSALKVLKLLSKKAVILAGDNDQSIYQEGFSLSHTGIDITGRTKILKTNFRNTVQIHSFAEKFRIKDTGQDPQLVAFRDGPPVEHVSANDSSSLIRVLTKKVQFFIQDLDYDAENICIITPSKQDFQAIQESLNTVRIASGSIIDKDFQFNSIGKIRLTTMHSAKGLDFPVVLLYLPNEPRFKEDYDDSLNHRIFKNLLYVAITRAMEHVNIFTLKYSQHPVIRDLITTLKDTNEEEHAM